MDTINKYIYYKYLATGLYNTSKLSSSANVTKPEHHGEIVKRCEACFGGGAISFDLSNAQEVVKFDKYTSDNTSWHVDRASNIFDDNSGDSISRNYITEEVKGLLKNNLTVNRAGDDIEVTFNFKETSAVKAVYEAEGVRTIGLQTPTGLSSIATEYKKWLNSVHNNIRFDELNSLLSDDKKSFTLTYKNPSEAAFGKVIEIVMNDNTPYDFFIGVSAIDNTVTFTSDNMSFTTEKDNLDTTGVFASNPLTKGTDYKKISEMLIGHCSNYLIYQPSFMVGNKKRNPKNQVDIKMTIPQGWNTEKIKVFRLNGTPSEGSLIEITQDDTTYSYALNGNELTLKTKDLNTTYILAQEGEAVSAETLKALENGVYSVDLVSWNLTQPGQLSMSNVAIDKDSTYLSVKDGVYTLYMKLQAIMISGQKGYAQKVLYSDDNEEYSTSKKEFTYYGWVRTEDKSSVYNVDYYGQTYGLYYPESMSVQIPQSAIDAGSLNADFWVPAMDEVDGKVPGSGGGHRSAQIKFYNLQKLSEDTVLPTYDSSYLLKSIEDAEKVISDKDTLGDMYNTGELQALSEQLTSARTSYELMKNEENINGDAVYQKSNEINQATRNLVLDSLKELVEKAGSYKADDYTEASYNTMRTSLESAILVTNNSSATTLEIKDELSKLYVSVSGLVKANTVDKSALTAKLADAKAEVAKIETYKPSTIAKLQSAIDAAQAVADSETATQQDVNEQVTKLETAIKALEKQVNKDALKAKYDEALETYNAGNADGRYSADTWADFEKAVNDAKTVLDNGDATESEVTAARTTLINAMNDLVVSADRSALKALLDEANGKDVSDCTEASVNAFNAAKASAQKVYEDVDASQNSIDKQFKLLSKAMGALVLKVDDSQVVYDGTYKIVGRLWQAGKEIPENWKDDTTDGSSMADPAINHEMLLTVKDGKSYLTVEFQKNQMTLFGEKREGYLKNLWYYPG